MIRWMLLASVWFLSACQSTHMSQHSVALNPSLKTSTICADIAVGDRVQGEDNAITLFKLFTIGPSKFVDGVVFGAGNSFIPDPDSKVKAAAAYRAIEGLDVDVIIDPRYTIKSTDFFIFKNTTAIVQGRSGTIRSFKHGIRCSDNIADAPSDAIDGGDNASAGDAAYVIQIASVGTASGASSVVNAHSQVADLKVYRTMRHGKPWFIVATGRYPSAQAAKSAINRLPASLKQGWISRSGWWPFLTTAARPSSRRRLWKLSRNSANSASTAC